MYLGSTPLLTKGPLALYFGGDPILEHLKDEPPWPGVTMMIQYYFDYDDPILLLKKEKLYWLL